MPRRQFAKPEAASTVDDILNRLHEDEVGVTTDTQIRIFAGREDAPDAIPRLMDLIEHGGPRENGALLVLVRILQRHDDAECPLDPLFKVLGRHNWVSQQRAAYALYCMLGAEAARRRFDEIARVLVPLTTSQRGRVLYPVLQALRHISGGHEYGRDPKAWKDWYESTYGGTIDLASGVYELLAVIRPEDPKDPWRAPWYVHGEKYEDKHHLVQAIKDLRARAERRNLPMKGVFVSDAAREEFDRPKVLKVFRESMLVRIISICHSVEFAHPSDDFHPPFEG